MEERKIALVTGATAYIGRAIAHELARRGAHVVVSGRNAAAGRSVAEDIVAAGGRAEFAAADLTDRGAVHLLPVRVGPRGGAHGAHHLLDHRGPEAGV